MISDARLGLVASVNEYFPEADWQRCVAHLYRNVFSHVPSRKMKEVPLLLKTIHAQKCQESAREEAAQVVDKLRAMQIRAASELVAEKIDETLVYYRYPPAH